MRNISLHLKEQNKRYLGCLFCSGYCHLWDGLRMLDWYLRRDTCVLFSCFILIFCLVDSYNVKYVWFENMQTVIPSVFPVQPVLVLYISDSAQWFLSIFHVLRSFVLIAGSCFTFHFILLFGSTLWNKCQSNVILLKVLNESPLRHFLFVSLHQIRE